MLRVLWVSHFLPYPPTGGVLQRGFGLVSRLARSCEVHLLAMHQPRLFRQTGGLDPTAKAKAIAELSKLCASVETVEIPSEQRSWGRAFAALRAGLNGRSYTEQWLASPAMRSAVAHATATIKPDLVHFDTISLAPYSDACGNGVRISLGHHNVESHMMWRRARNTLNKVARRLLHIEAGRILQLERTYAPRVDLNVVCSELDARRLQRLAHPRRVHVAENGVLEPEVDIAEYMASTQPATRLLFIGRMSAYTNRDAAEFLVQQVWPAVAARRPNLTLDIVGSGAPKCAEELAARDPRVRVHGFVSDLAPLLSPDCIFVCPIRDGGGTKLKILDAMNRGLPIVAHPMALEGIPAEHDKHVLVAQTAGEFADAIALLLDAPDKRRALIGAAFELVRTRYAFDAIAEGLRERFQSLVSFEHSTNIAQCRR